MKPQMQDIKSGLDVYVPFAESLGVRVVRRETGDVELELDLADDQLTSWGTAHGGVIMSVLDIAMALSAKSLDEASSDAATVELKTNFLKMATGRIRARARAQRAGRSLVFADGELRNEPQELIARATGTFKLQYPRKGGD